ncbi:MAG TPA: hypothetical protein VFE37_26155 [Chloroflexota bacterium]|nr:hypothetical protein [Chloroflexota bacterium]
MAERETHGTRDEPLRIEYDAEYDRVKIEGVVYSGRYFRELGVHGMETGTWFRIVREADGSITIVRERSYGEE